MSILKCHCGGSLKVRNRFDHYLHTECIRCGSSSQEMIMNHHFSKNTRKKQPPIYKRRSSIIDFSDPQSSPSNSLG